MSHTDVTYEPPAPPDPAEASLGQLVSSVSQQIPELIRSEIRLAQAEMAEKGKRAGLGLGLFGAAGLLALYGVAGLLTTVVLLLALVLPAWAAALVVTAVLFAAAGVAALKGKSNVEEATPPKPERALDGIKADVETMKGGHA